MPLLWLSLAFVSGILLGDVLHLSWALWLGLGAVDLAAWLILRRFTPGRINSAALNRFAYSIPGLSLPAAALVLAVFAGGLRYQLAHPALTRQDIAWYNGQGSLLLTGIIDAPPVSSAGITTLRVKVQQIAPAPMLTASTMASQKATLTVQTTTTPQVISSPAVPASPVSVPQVARGMLLAYLTTSKNWNYGDQVTLVGALELPAPTAAFSYRDSLARQGISAQLNYPTVTLIQSGQGNPLVAAMYAFKARGMAALAATFPTPEAELLQGIILGDASNIPPDIAQAYITTGTAHIIAISGFNISILAVLFSALFTRLLGRRWGALVAFIAILFYTLLVGAGASVVRAAIMGSLGLLAVQVGRRQNSPNSLIFTAGLMCLFNPNLPWDVSFQLSFGATLGMVLYAQPLQDAFIRLVQRFTSKEAARYLGGPVSEYLLFTIAAQSTSLPVMVYHFKQLSMISLVANPLVLPAQPAVEVLGGLATLGGIISHPLGQVLAYAAWPFMAYTNRVVAWLAVVPQHTVDLGQLSLLLVMLYYLILFSVTLVKNWGTTLRGVFSPPVAITTAGVLAILIWQAAFALPDGRLHLTLLSSVPPASLLVESPGGRAVLVNGGADAPQLNEFLSQKLPYFGRHLDYLVVASDNKNALDALPATLSAIPCAAALWSGSTTGSAAARQLDAALSGSTVPIAAMSPGDSLDLGDGARLNVLEADANGTLLLLEWRSFRALLPFPAANLPLAAITSPSAVSVLLLAGHGEDIFNPPAWLSGLQPQLVLASLDPGGAQPQIEVQVQAALKDYPVLTNVDHGWIEVSTDGDRMWVTTEK